MYYILAPLPKLQVVDDNGNPLANGKLYTYIAGSGTPLATYKDSVGTANANPIVLDSGGRGSVWIDPQKSYKFLLTTSTGVMVWTVDNINAAGLTTVIYVSTIAALKALTGVDGGVVTVLGYYAANDGGGGDFIFSSGISATPDNGMVVAPTAGTGNWLRVADGYIDLKWYGAVNDGTTDNYAALAAAYVYAIAQTDGWYISLSAGSYYISSAIIAPDVVIKLAPNAAFKSAITGFVAQFVIDKNDRTRHFIFSSSATATLVNCDEIYPEWFGVVGDGSHANNTKTTDDQTNLQYCVNSAEPGQTIVFDSEKKYWTSAIMWKSGVSMRGSQPLIKDNASLLRGNIYFAGTSGNFISLTNSGTGGIRGISTRDLILDGNSFAAIGLALDTYGSDITNCIIKNCTAGIVFAGSSASINNRVSGCVLDTCATGISNSGAGSTNGQIDNCVFPACTNDIALTVTTGWIVKNNTDANGYNIVEKFSSTLVGNTASSQAVTESAAAKVVIYNENILGGLANSVIQIKAEGGWVDTSATHTTASDVWNRKHLLRFTTDATNASAGIHDSLGLQIANKTPKTDTRAWYERHMDGSHHWGDQAVEWMSITSAGLTILGGRVFTAQGADVISASSIDIIANYTNITGQNNINYILTTGWIVGSRISLSLNGVKLYHNTGAPGAGYANIYVYDALVNNVSYITVGLHTPSDMIETIDLIYDGTYWRMISGHQ